MTRKRTLTIINFLLDSPASPASAQDIVLTEFGGYVRKGTYHGPRTTIDWKGCSGEEARVECTPSRLHGLFVGKVLVLLLFKGKQGRADVAALITGIDEMV